MTVSGIAIDATAAARRLAGDSAIIRLGLLGTASLVLTAATPLAFQAGGDNAYMAMAVAIGGVAMAATWIAERAPAAKALWLIIAIAVLLRAFLLVLDPLLSTDIYRYVWDGKVQAAGINPYRYVPADETLAALRDGAIYPHINRAHYAVTAYPPVAQMFFFLVTRLGETVTTVKLALAGCEAVTATVIALLLRRIGRPVTRLVAYAWHPLPMWEIANSGHIDALMVALMMLGLWLALTGRSVRGAAAIALGALAKPFALLALPAIWRPWDWKMPLTVLAVAALCYLPYLSAGWGALGFFASGYVHEEELDTGGNFWLLAIWRQMVGAVPGDVAVYLAAGGSILAAMAMVAAYRRERSAETMIADITRLLLVFLLLLSPNYPWYFLAVTPFVALRGGAPLWVVTVGAVLLQDEATWDFQVPEMTRKSILFGAFLLACAYATWRARQKTPAREQAP